MLCEYKERSSAERKPFECDFGILKNRFRALSSCIHLLHKDDVWFSIIAYAILHNTNIDDSDSGKDFIVDDDDYILITGRENTAEKKIREDLLDYALSKEEMSSKTKVSSRK